MSKKKKQPASSFVDHTPRSFWGVLGGLGGIITVSVLLSSLLASTTLPVLAIATTSTTKTTDIFEDLPSELDLGKLMEKTNVFAKDSAGNDVLLASFFDQNREEVDWPSISSFVEDAAISGEDPRFYEHGGIDPQGTGRALVSNMLGKDLQGGSSITQQYVKNVLIQKAESITDPVEQKKAYLEATETSFNRKLKEMKYSIGLEKNFSKKQILLGYLNIIGFGDRIYGIQSAAKYYFGVNAKDLTLAQSATLIAIVNNPNKLKINQPENEENGAANGYLKTKERRDYVLKQMLKETRITQAQYDEALATPITPVISPSSVGCQTAAGAGYFCDYVTWVIKNDPAFGETEEDRAATLRRGGLQIYTTLDMDLQAASEAAINNNVPKAMDNVNIGSSSVSVQPGTGRILAMAQNKDFSNDQEVLDSGPNYTSVNYNSDFAYGGSSGFQPGSTYKVFTLLEWLRTGHTLTESVNGKQNYSHFTNTCDGDWYGDYTVRNDEGGTGGRTTALNSTINSINTGFMGMAQELDLCGIKSMAESFGVKRADGEPLQSNPTAVLGTNEVSGLSMATAFAGIASGGIVCSPIAIDRITDADGKDIPAPKSNCSQAVEPAVAQQAISALQQVMSSGTGSSSNLRDGIPVIGKTGTTDDAIHTWMVGSTTSVSTAVWVGNVSGYANMRSLSINGTQAALIRHIIWPSVMATADAKYGGHGF